MNRRQLAFVLTVAAGVVVPGLATHLLQTAGYPRLGTAAWIGGYLCAVVLVWYVWIRPLEITGPIE